MRNGEEEPQVQIRALSGAEELLTEERRLRSMSPEEARMDRKMTHEEFTLRVHGQIEWCHLSLVKRAFVMQTAVYRKLDY